MELGFARSMCTLSETLGSEIGGSHEYCCGQAFLHAKLLPLPTHFVGEATEQS